MAATAAITSASTAVRLGDRNRNPNRQLRQIVTSSRDKSFIVWHLTKEDKVYGLPRRRLTSHSHFVEDVICSSDGQFAIIDNWDQTVVFSEIMNPNGR